MVKSFACASRSKNEALDAGPDHAPDLDGLSVLGLDVGKGRIGSLEAYPSGTLVQVLHREFTIDHRHHDVPVLRLDRAVHHQGVAVINARPRIE